MTAGVIVHRPPETDARCKGCHAPILWVIRETKGDKKRIPLDVPTVDPRTRGAFVVVYSRNGIGWAYQFTDLAEKVARRNACSLARAEEIVDVTYDAHLTHFTSCTRADSFRRRGGRR